jgi:hypothetical protein
MLKRSIVYCRSDFPRSLGASTAAVPPSAIFRKAFPAAFPAFGNGRMPASCCPGEGFFERPGKLVGAGSGLFAAFDAFQQLHDFSGRPTFRKFGHCLQVSGTTSGKTDAAYNISVNFKFEAGGTDPGGRKGKSTFHGWRILLKDYIPFFIIS